MNEMMVIILNKLCLFNVQAITIQLYASSQAIV